MTEPQTQVSPELDITFRDRQIWVKMPSPEQILVWKRTLKQLQGAEVSGWNGDQVMKALERSRLIIDSVIAHEPDKDWLDEEMLAGNIGLMESAQIINMALERFAEAAQENGNREDRRQAAKKTAKKATRKAPSR